MGNVAAGDKMLWMHLVSIWVKTGVCLYLADAFSQWVFRNQARLETPKTPKSPPRHPYQRLLIGKASDNKTIEAPNR